MIALRINAPGRSVSEEKMRSELIAFKQKTEKLHVALLQYQALFEHSKTLVSQWIAVIYKLSSSSLIISLFLINMDR